MPAPEEKMITVWSWALLERPLDVRPLDSFPVFYGTRRFNTEFTRAPHLFLSWARPVQFTSPHPISPRSILILSTHLRLGLPFPLAFPPMSYTRSSSSAFVLHDPPISSSTCWTHLSRFYLKTETTQFPKRCILYRTLHNVQNFDSYITIPLSLTCWARSGDVMCFLWGMNKPIELSWF
jgi:hypothetical protein